MIDEDWVDVSEQLDDMISDTNGPKPKTASETGEIVVQAALRKKLDSEKKPLQTDTTETPEVIILTNDASIQSKAQDAHLRAFAYSTIRTGSGVRSSSIITVAGSKE